MQNSDPIPTDDLPAATLRDLLRTFRNYKALGDGALAQLSSDAPFHTRVDPDANSVAVIVKHLAGNLRSRLTDFLTSDGDKPDRDRDAEFEMPERATREEVLQWWDSGWTVALASLDALTADDLAKTVTIRGESFLVVEALNRLATHTAYHVGQIVFLVKHLAGPEWRTLSIPKGQSKRYAIGTFKEGMIHKPR